MSPQLKGTKGKKEPVDRPYIEFGRLVRNLRLRKGLSQSNLAEAVTLHPSYLSRMEHGERRPSPNVLKQMSGVLDYPLAELLAAAKLVDEGFPVTVAPKRADDALMLKVEQLERQLAQMSARPYQQRGPTPRFQESKVRAIPVFDRVPAGVALPEARGTYREMPTLTLTEDELQYAPQAFALVVTGDSMVQAGILEGDIVVVSPTLEIEDGDTVVAVVGDDDVSLKKVYFEGDRILLQAANPSYRPILLKYPEEAEILGKVALVRRRLRR